MKDKRLLLKLSEKISVVSSQEAINQVFNLIHSVEEETCDKDKLIYYMFIADKSKEVLGGFNSAMDKFSKLINEVFCIEKVKDKIIMNNKDYNSLNFHEFKYVMGWARRIAKSEKNNKNKGKNNVWEKSKVKNIGQTFSKDECDERWAKLKEFKF